MSCVPDRTIYRLLDMDSGWFELTPLVQGVTGFNSPGGLCLSGTGAIECRGHERRIPPPRLAWDACRCEWLLVTPAPSRVIKLGPCDCDWQPMWSARCEPFEGSALDAIAAYDGHFAVADHARGAVLHFARRGAMFLGTTGLSAPRLLSYGMHGQLVVCCDEPDGTVRIAVIDRRLRVERVFAVSLPSGSRLVGMRMLGNEAWLLYRQLPIERAPAAHDAQEFRLLRIDVTSGAATTATSRELVRRLSPLPIALVTADGFCIERGRRNEAPRVSCFTWYGRCAERDDLERALPSCAPRFVTDGKYFAEALDSGIEECRWHRVVLDAELPPRASIRVSLATTADGKVPAGGLTWTRAANPDANDFLVMVTPGRFLHLLFEFAGDGNVTPRLRRVRLEFPRATSIEHLPPVFRESGRAEDFTERLLALFDSILADIDSSIESFPALFDLDNTPDEVLPWIGTLLDVAYDPRWSARVRRRVLHSIPALYAQRGTRQGLRRAIELVFGANCEIEELGPQRAYAALAFGARLGSLRVFGRASARMRLDTSALGRAQLRSFGNPDRDALSADAFRFRVLVSPSMGGSEPLKRRLAELVSAQKPAHTVETLRTRRTGWVVGTGSSIGVDTAFTGIPKPVLGRGGNIRLRRNSILAAGSRPARPGGATASNLRVGINSHLE
ncbi:phage tail-like protein [Bradyrhizobium sp. AZCC 1610]|uniref:phage tail protein n=1 Tax=Bradyrhizobium sp. AZCC 1610 TaxID=3117020 RepID=UPI002FEF75B1